ncbi:MAG: hypothetical protein HeimC3_01690 [Candidatus Heimdallarchaeota archaeon LC_3]|nr:MAG: hypothetical protein HeimC3_01690 [Candidatus Heimdallarchaeota archaeon LC_3]
MEALVKIGMADIFGLLIFILGLLTAVVGLYIYFKKEKKTHILLIGLGALFIMLAGLDNVVDFFRENLIDTWGPFMYFIGILLIFLSTEPWKALSD